MSNLNSIRPDGGTSLRPLSEVRPVAQASRNGKSLAVAGGAGQRNNERVLKETVSEGKAATSPSGGWRQNGRKCKRSKQQLRELVYRGRRYPRVRRHPRIPCQLRSDVRGVGSRRAGMGTFLGKFVRSLWGRPHHQPPPAGHDQSVPGGSRRTAR